MAKSVVICMPTHVINFRSISDLMAVIIRSIRSMMSVECLAKSSRVASVGIMASSLASFVSIRGDLLSDFQHKLNFKSAFFSRDKIVPWITLLRDRLVSFANNSFCTNLVRYFPAPFCSFRNSVFKILP